MRKISGRVPSAWRKNYADKTAKSVGLNILTAICFAILGAILLLIPVLGWIAAAFCWMAAFWALVGSLGSPILNLFTTKRHANAELVKLRCENTYTDLICPACKKAVPFKGSKIVNWPNEREDSLVCQHCAQKIQRISSELLWVPHPQVNLTGSIAEYFHTSPPEFIQESGLYAVKLRAVTED